MVSHPLHLLALVGLISYITALPIALPGCPDHCGNVTIPYPFGIGPNCFHDQKYEILCKNESKPFLRTPHFQVQNIFWPSGSNGVKQMMTVLTPSLSFCSSNGSGETSVDLRNTPFRLSRLQNVLVVKNCGGSVVLKDSNGTILTGCTSYCANRSSSITNIDTCYGIGCCQASLLPPPSNNIDGDPEGIDFYKIAVDQRAAITNSSSCNLVAALIDTSYANTYAQGLSSLSSFPAILEWTVIYLPSHYYTSQNVICAGGYSYQCYCKSYHEGNPYLPNGCQVVKECLNCSDHCTISLTTGVPYCEKHHHSNRASILGFSIGMGVIMLSLGCYWLYRLIKWRKEIRRKAEYFKRNGGLLLQQQMTSSDGVVENTKIFAVSELENATENFNENRILGEGGQGTVYKGMLTDGRIVAIKKSKQVDESQLNQFINEVIILSQINHRNVVQLLGCCLETEVPLLVYEFVQNGTLYQHLHDPTDDFHVTWKMRLQIAAESAGALSYLHSSSSVPIYHRDIKSSNILLDEKYRAKVSDFGISRAITIEQTHVTTCVQGTYGYLDPEYFQSNQFTEKSDVYSFGVVLVELITGKKPINATESGGWISLATEFLTKMETGELLNMLDTRIYEEGKQEEFNAVADLAKKCLNMNGKQRPTMKDVAMVLDEIRSPPVTNLKELSCVKSEHEVNENVELYNDFFSEIPFISGSSESTKYFSFEVQPPKTNI